MDSGSSLGIALSSDVSTTSSKAMPSSSSATHPTSSGASSFSGAAHHGTEEEHLCSAVDPSSTSMKELTPSVYTPIARPTVIALTSSQDSLYQVDSGVSYDRESTPGSFLNPENADIVYHDAGFVVSNEDPFTSRTDCSYLSPSHASPRSRSVSMNSGSECSTLVGSTATAVMSPDSASAVAAASSDAHPNVTQEQVTMPHRTPVILSGTIPSMVKASYSVHNLAPSLSFSYGPVPNHVGVSITHGFVSQFRTVTEVSTWHACVLLFASGLNLHHFDVCNW